MKTSYLILIILLFIITGIWFSSSAVNGTDPTNIKQTTQNLKVNSEKTTRTISHAISKVMPNIGITETTPAPPLVKSARKQIGVTVRYDPAYVKLDFPMGDIPMDRGVCTDVIVRAYRGQGKDLQVLVNADMKKAWNKYPKIWGLKRPDKNIDHRRVPNLQVFFKRHGKSLKVTNNPADYKAGDIVTWTVGQNLPHIGIVSNRRKKDSGTPLIIHNIGLGTQENDMLFDYKITGHYRY